MLDFPIEQIQLVSNQYSTDECFVIDIKYLGVPVDLIAFLAWNIVLGKINVYICIYPCDFNTTLKMQDPCSLEIAQKIFPEHNLTEENYGFNVRKSQ